MPIELTYRAAMERLAELADGDNPSHVQVKAACKLADELSPNNLRHAAVMRELNNEPTESIPAVVTATIDDDAPLPHPYALLSEVEEETDEDDPTENGQDDDEPP